VGVVRWLAYAAIVAGVMWLCINEPTYDQIYNHWWIVTIAALALIGGGAIGVMRRMS
jgi:hypothetical protein